MSQPSEPRPKLSRISCPRFIPRWRDWNRCKRCGFHVDSHRHIPSGETISGHKVEVAPKEGNQ